MHFYLKYYNETIAIIDVQKNIPHSMKIVNPHYFFDKQNASILDQAAIEDWIKNRIRPESQIGFDRLLEQFKVDSDSNYWYWTLFVKTKGMNIKDRLWLSDKNVTTNNDNPWTDILANHSSITSLNLIENTLEIFKTKTNINIDGACEKDIISVKGNLAILKASLQHNTYDCIAEELCYKIARQLKLSCAPTKYIKNDLCYSLIDENLNLIHAKDFLDYSDWNIEELYRRLEKKNVTDKTKIDYLRMCLFDVLTRQLDRNTTNFSFYETNGTYNLYRLYDNGLSLFSCVRYKNSKVFFMGKQTSDTVIAFCVKELKALKVNKLFLGRLNKEFLTNIFLPYKDDIYMKNGNKIDTIITWIINQYEDILLMYNKEK